MRLHRNRLSVLLVHCLAFSGCISSDRVTSTGTVTFEGRPVENGLIIFRPLDGRAAPAGAVITKGHFVVEGSPGKHRVEIRGTRPVDPAKLPRTMPRFEGLTVHEDFIPPHYNATSMLEIEVASDGRNIFTFELKSNP